MTTRRNILTMLGLAAATTPAIATDDMANTELDGGPMAYRLNKYDPERMATALERLAAEIRLPNSVNVSLFRVESDLCGPDDWLRQRLVIDVEIMHPDKA